MQFRQQTALLFDSFVLKWNLILFLGEKPVWMEKEDGTPYYEKNDIDDYGGGHWQPLRQRH